MLMVHLEKVKMVNFVINIWSKKKNVLKKNKGHNQGLLNLVRSPRAEAILNDRQVFSFSCNIKTPRHTVSKINQLQLSSCQT